MFIKRTRSTIRGPTQRQTYVPHDQRQVNTEPTPIKTEKMAQYYYNQLKNMGYLQQSIPQIVTVNIINQDDYCSFDLDATTQGFNTSNIDSNTCYLTDINGNALDIKPDIQNNILNQQGYKLYPIIVNGDFGYFNGTESNKTAYLTDMDGGSSTSKTVSSRSYWKISTNYSYFTQAYVAASGTNMLLILYKDNSTAGQYDLIYASKTSFYIYTKKVICILLEN